MGCMEGSLRKKKLVAVYWKRMELLQKRMACMEKKEDKSCRKSPSTG